MKDEVIEKLLKITNPFVMGAIEEISPFDQKSEKERKEIMEVALRSLEVATVITTKFFDLKNIDEKKLKLVEEAVLGKNYEKASELLK